MSSKDIGAVGGDLKAKLAGQKKPTETVIQSNGEPLEIDMDLIDEDPNQPRKADNPGFSDESIAELGATIKARGLKTPISIRYNPEKPGRYLINHGARRYRGNKWAGNQKIKAFKDNDYNEADQVIENLQRNELTAREIADYIGRELAKGKKKGEIAATLGKSAAFVTQHSALLDLPEPIADVFNSGRCRDVTLINELVTVHKKKPAEVSEWLADETQEITRGSVKLLREFLDDKANKPNGDDDNQGGDDGKGTEGAGDQKEKKEKQEDPDKIKKAIIQVKHDDRPARINLTKRPPAEGFAWIKYDDDGHEVEVNLAEVQLVALVEG
jgi:ParB family transcriptional regulator, chromosome partitioning protein